MRVFCVHGLLLELALATALCGAMAAAPAVCSALDAESDTLGPDKALHYTVSVGLTLGASFVCDVIGLDEPITLPLSIGFAVVMGVGKETFDAIRGTGFSAADLTWDLLGIATGVLLRVLIRALFDPDARDSDERIRARPQSQPRVALHFFLTK
jgi:uncharacterized protein YfiM (DUF2279 family)